MKIFMSAHSPLPFDMAVQHVSISFSFSFHLFTHSLAFFFLLHYIVLFMILLKLCAFSILVSPLTHRQIESLAYILKMSTQLTHYLQANNKPAPMQNAIFFFLSLVFVMACLIDWPK